MVQDGVRHPDLLRLRAACHWNPKLPIHVKLIDPPVAARYSFGPASMNGSATLLGLDAEPVVVGTLSPWVRTTDRMANMSSCKVAASEGGATVHFLRIGPLDVHPGRWIQTAAEDAQWPPAGLVTMTYSAITDESGVPLATPRALR